MRAADKDIIWWQWTIGQINGLVGTIRAPNSYSPDALAVNKCICHDEYALLREYIHLLIRSETLQRQQLRDHPAERVKTYEQYVFLSFDCRAECIGRARGMAMSWRRKMKISSKSSSARFFSAETGLTGA